MDGIPHICYSDEHLVCPTCCPVALIVSSTIQTVKRTNTIETKIQSNIPVACCTNSKPHSTDCIPPNCYSDKYLVYTTCYPVALTVIPTILTVHLTIKLVTNISPTLHVTMLHLQGDSNYRRYTTQMQLYLIFSLPYLLACCTKSKPHSSDGTPHSFNSDEIIFCPTCCPSELTVSPKVQTEHRTIAIVTNGQTNLPVAMLH